MKLALRIVLVLLLAAAGVWVWLWLHPSPEKLIRKRLNSLAEKISFDAKDGQASRMLGAQSVFDYFTVDATVVVNVSGFHHTFSDRDEIAAAATASRQFQSLDAKFLDPKISVAPDKQSAQVEVTARVLVPGQEMVVQEMKISFLHANKEWRISRAETVNVLE